MTAENETFAWAFKQASLADIQRLCDKAEALCDFIAQEYAINEVDDEIEFAHNHPALYRVWGECWKAVRALKPREGS